MKLQEYNDIYVITLVNTKHTETKFDFFIINTLDLQFEEKASIKVTHKKKQYNLHINYVPDIIAEDRIKENFINQLFNLEQEEKE